MGAAVAFTIVAIMSLFYSMAIFLWRVDRIHQRKAVSYHDKWGPTFLCIGLAACIAVAVGLRFTKGGEGDLRGRHPGGKHS